MKNKTLVYGIILEIGLGIATAWLFFDFSIASITVPIFFLPEHFRLKRKLEEKKDEKIEDAFRDLLGFLRNALMAGYSAERALRISLEELKKMYGEDNEFLIGLKGAINKMETGHSMEKALTELAQYFGKQDMMNFAEIFALAKRTGGNINTVISQTAGIIRDKSLLKREIHAEIGARENEFRIMCMIPHGMIFYLRMFAPEMVQGIYRNSFGEIFMLVVLILYVLLRNLGEYVIRRSFEKI